MLVGCSRVDVRLEVPILGKRSLMVHVAGAAGAPKLGGVAGAAQVAPKAACLAVFVHPTGRVAYGRCLRGPTKLGARCPARFLARVFDFLDALFSLFLFGPSRASPSFRAPVNEQGVCADGVMNNLLANIMEANIRDLQGE